MFKCFYNLIFTFLFTILFFNLSLYAKDSSSGDNNITVHINNIAFDGSLNTEEQTALNDLAKKYVDNDLTIAGIEKLKSSFSAYYKNRGMLFTKVALPPQDLSSGILKFSIVKTKVEDINVTGNKYYSTAFIKRNFHFKKGEYLTYNQMLKSLLLLNSYEDLSVKSYLKKGSTYGTTDINLEVKDSRPFHTTVTFDNLGSKDTSKNRLSLDINYGNLINDGDNISLHTTFGIDSVDSETTKLILSNYETTPIGNYFTRLNFAYLYADYITAGDLSVLELKGDTTIYTLGLKQPLYYSSTLQTDATLNYYRKDIKSYLLGALSSEDKLDILELKGNIKYRRVFDALESSIGIAKGFNGDDSLSSRYGANTKFTKYLLRLSYNRYINELNSVMFTLDSQYSADRVPLSELYTIGGLSSVRAFDPAQKLGDSGYTTNLEWFLHPKLNYYSWLKNSTQIGIYADYGKVFNNNPIPGEEKTSSLAAAGGEILVNINKRYFGRLSVGYPLHASDTTIDKSTHVYGYVGIKIW